MEEEEKKAGRMEAEAMQVSVIIKHKKKVMKENTANQPDDNSPQQGPNSDRGLEEGASEVVKGNPGHQRGSADVGSASSMDEKSSGMGRRDKGTGLATKDGLTGSDYDGQLTE